MTIVNLTPHTVRIVEGEGEDLRVITELPAMGTVVRARQTDVPVGAVEIDGIAVPLVKTEFGEVENLPEPDGETMYVVSLIAAQAAMAGGRTGKDLLYPSGVPVRDGAGQIVGVRALARAEI